MRRLALLSTIVWLASSGCSPGPERALPEPYRSLPVPEDLLGSPAARVRGRALYLAHCALCHGERADGRGRRREALSVSPADFTSPDWRSRATPHTVYFAIREGRRGTPMPAWRSLTPEETWDLAAYLLSAGGEAR